MWCYFLRVTETELTILDDHIFNFILRRIILVMTAVLCSPKILFVMTFRTTEKPYKKRNLMFDKWEIFQCNVSSYLFSLILRKNTKFDIKGSCRILKW